MTRPTRSTTNRPWLGVLRWCLIAGAVAVTALSVFVIGSLFTSALAGSEARNLDNRALAGLFMGGGVALLGLVPWIAASEGVRGPWRRVALVFVLGGCVLAITTIVGITVPD